MVKLLVFAILLASSPATGLIETLFRNADSCYTTCQSKYETKTSVDACKRGCGFGFQNEDCETQCATFSTDEESRSCCKDGCIKGRSLTDAVKPQQPIVAVDPVPEIKDSAVVPAASSESGRPRSIILIRLRQRPSLDMPSPGQLIDSDPIQFFNNIIKQFQEKAQNFDQSVRESLAQNTNDLPKLPEFGAISEFAKNIPIIRLSGNVRADSSSESSEEDQHPLIAEFKHLMQHPREHEQYLRERAQPINGRVKQFFTDVRSEWNDLVRKQPKIPVWIFLGILLSSSAILWYMVMSLCRHAPSHNVLSVRAQELIFHPYEHDAYEKEKIQPDDQPYEVTESLPIKVKLANV